ncbi:Peptidase S74 domain-containing protein [Entamoeba marina]
MNNNQFPLFISPVSCVNIPVKEVPRTQKQRKKNWKCNYTNCDETPKTRYNCYAHVWDAHIKPSLSVVGNNPNNIVLISFKNSQQKPVIKKMCEQYMVKLVDKTHGRQNYPFAFTESIAPLIGNALNSMQTQPIQIRNNSNEITQNSQSDHTTEEGAQIQQEFTSIPMYAQHDRLLSKTDSDTQDISYSDPQQWQQFEENLDNKNEEENIQDLLTIKKIGHNLHQLQMFGELFSENGFLVRSDERSKTQIESVKMLGKRFKYLTDSSSTPSRYGFIAQEVQEIFPDLVIEDSDGCLSVDVLGLIPVIVESLKEIQEESEMLNSKTYNEFEILQTTAKNALSQIDYIKNELPNKQPIKEKKRHRNDIRHCFGPTIVLFFSSIIFTITSLIFPLIRNQYYFIEIGLLIICLAQWIFVIINKEEVREIIVGPESLTKIFQESIYWSTLQIIIWSAVLTILVCAITLSLIVGVIGVFISAVYVACFLGLTSLSVFIHYNVLYSHKEYIVLTIMVFYHIICGIILVSLIGMQPYNFFELNHLNSNTVIQTNVDQTIIPVELPVLPWNCYQPSFSYTTPLPNGIEIILPLSYIGLEPPTLEGKVSFPCSITTNVALRCGIINLDYTTISFTAL